MKGNTITFLALAAVVVLLIVYLFTFQVRANEVAVHYRRGTIHRIVNMERNEAGLKFRLPRPFDRVVKYDKRVRVLEGPAVEMQLKDQRQVIISMYAAWQIADPRQFVESQEGDEDRAERALNDIIYDETSVRLGQADFKDLVNANQQELQYDRIMADISAAVRQALEKRGYGLKVVSFGVRQIAIPPSETTLVLERMQKERAALAAKFTAQGQSGREVIRSNALREADEILAQADLEAEGIKAKAEEDVSQYYKVFAKEPDLAVFLDDMKSLKAIAGNASKSGTPLTLVVDMLTPPFSWLRTGPEGDQAKASANGTPAAAAAAQEEREE